MPDLVPGVPSALSPLVRRIVAPNPGPFTGPGTNTYLVGIDEVAVIDPGPDEKSHIDAIVTHALFPAELTRDFLRAGIRSIRSTNSVPHPTNAITLDAVLADALRREVAGAAP